MSYLDSSSSSSSSNTSATTPSAPSAPHARTSIDIEAAKDSNSNSNGNSNKESNNESNYIASFPTVALKKCTVVGLWGRLIEDQDTCQICRQLLKEPSMAFFTEYGE